MEILINPGYGGFSFSDRTVALYQERTGKEASTYLDGDWDELRIDPVMISIVKELGKEENPDLVIKTIRPGYESFYKIHEYDGAESITYDEAAYTLHQLRINVRAALTDPTLSYSARIATALALLS
jgi:hypothetical protein